MDMRNELRSMFAEAMDQSRVTAELAETVGVVGGELRIAGLTYRLGEFAQVAIVAIGKAAAPMCEYAARLLEPAMTSGQELVGVAVGAVAEASLPAGIGYIRGGHPLPDENSFAAGNAILALLRTLDERSLVLFLVSGGGSAMLELPIDAAIGLEETRAFHQGLLHSGLPVLDMNVLRKHCSAVKGGRLAVAAGAATQCTVLVSDVPGDALHVVSSGPSLPDPSTLEDCRRLIETRGLEPMLRGRVLDFLRSGDCPETPKPGDAAFARSATVCLLSNERLLQHAADAAAARGYAVTIDTSCDDWDVAEAAKYLLERLKSLGRLKERVCLISGGEVLVTIEGEAGAGGRNQHFALECAARMKEYFSAERVAVLSAGSDGIDGNSDAAGAVVDGTTLRRAAAAGFDVGAVLRGFDSGSLFAGIGDAVVTGPSGNNLRDLRVLICDRLEPAG